MTESSSVADNCGQQVKKQTHPFRLLWICSIRRRNFELRCCLPSSLCSTDSWFLLSLTETFLIFFWFFQILLRPNSAIKKSFYELQRGEYLRFKLQKYAQWCSPLKLCFMISLLIEIRKIKVVKIYKENTWRSTPIYNSLWSSLLKSIINLLHVCTYTRNKLQPKKETQSRERREWQTKRNSWARRQVSTSHTAHLKSKWGSSYAWRSPISNPEAVDRVWNCLININVRKVAP